MSAETSPGERPLSRGRVSPSLTAPSTAWMTNPAGSLQTTQLGAILARGTERRETWAVNKGRAEQRGMRPWAPHHGERRGDGCRPHGGREEPHAQGTPPHTHSPPARVLSEPPSPRGETQALPGLGETEHSAPSDAAPPGESSGHTDLVFLSIEAEGGGRTFLSRPGNGLAPGDRHVGKIKNI